MSRGATALASLLVTLGRPAWWVHSLAAFLIRGGWFLFLLPIVAIPSPLAVSNALGPVIVPIALGRFAPEALIAIALLIGGLLLWLLAGWGVAAAAEGTVIREAAEAAAEEGLAGRSEDRPSRDGAEVARRMLAARLIALVPLFAAIAWGTIGIVEATYAELTRPLDVATPLVVRVIDRAALQLATIVLTWLLAEVVGGAAGRRIAVDGRAPGPALMAAASDAVRRPGSTVVPWLVTSAALAVVLGGLLLAAGVAWQGLQGAIVDPTAAPPAILVSLIAFVATWLAALALTGLLTAVRTSTGVFEDARIAVRVPPEAGTFGAGQGSRPGDWSVGDGGGSL
jgi:hypothetical protein